MQNQIRVGVGILILRDGKVLWSKRKGSHGDGTWGLCGGHVEYGETLEQAIVREVAEECGVRIKNLQYLCTSDFLTYYPKHFVDVGFAAEWESGEPQLLEPHKFEVWEWRSIDDVPSPVFPPCLGYLEAYRTGKRYFTYGKPTPAGEAND